MALSNTSGNIIALGYNCHVRVGTNAADAEVIAMVASYNVTEDFQVQDATALGHLGAIAIDSQGYTCSGSLNGFLPSKRVLDGAQQYADGGKIALMDIIPSRAQFMEPGAISKIVYMDLYNKKAGKVLVALEGVIITSSSVSVDGGAYAKNDVQFRALSWEKD